MRIWRLSSVFTGVRVSKRDCRTQHYQSKQIITIFFGSFFPGKMSPFASRPHGEAHACYAIFVKTKAKYKTKRATAALIGALLVGVIGSRAFAFEPLLPNAKLTPGRIAHRPSDTRGVTESMQDEVFARYHIPLASRPYYIIDHLIPMELGGADDIRNLWPQRLSARPYGPRRKRLLTQRLLEMIAAKQITVAEAQREMGEDWISAFVSHIGMVYLSPNAQPMASD